MDPTIFASPPPPKKDPETPPSDRTILAYPTPPPQNPPTPPAPPQVPMPPPLEPKKRGKWLYIGVAGAVIVGVCCLLGVVALVVFNNLQKKAAPVQSPLGTAVPVIFPPATSLPLATLPPAATIPPAPASDPVTTSFSDDFSNSESGWEVISSNGYETSYGSLGTFEMGVKNANSYLVSTSPDSIARPLKDVILKVRAEPAVGDTGSYGVVCRYQDINNFYMAGISGNSFYIGKQVNGKWSFLTDPGWQDLPDAKPDADGYFSIAMSCIDSFIVLEVNGVGAAHVTDQDFSSGNIGLAVWAGEQPDHSGYYARANFDDFSAALP